MLILGPHRRTRAPRRGAALLLSFLVLMVIIAVVYQLNRSTGIDQQVSQKDLLMTKMDLALESALLEVQEQLREDAELKSAASEGGGAEGAMGAGGDMGGAGDEPGEGGAAENPDAVDSQMDGWAQVATTSFDDINLRIYIEDEDRKYNVLNMLVDDEDAAEDAFERVMRILDLCREGTEADISGGDADEMARAMRDHMLERDSSYLPRPTQLLSDDPEHADRGLPLTMREFVVIEPFTEDHFRDYFDREGNRVHSIASFLTVYTSPAIGPLGEGGEQSSGGVSVNVNTAPLAVLAGLFEQRDISTRTWDQVLDYRNEEEERDDEEQEEIEPVLDEFGNEVVPKKIFDSLSELSELPDWNNLEAEMRAEAESMLRVDSDVFSVFITARFVTAAEVNQQFEFDSRAEQERYERSGRHFTRTVRAVLWRRQGEDGVDIVPLVRWDLLDYAPLPVLDFPDDDWGRR